MTKINSSKTLNLVNFVFLILLFSVFIFMAFLLVKDLDSFHNKDFFTFWLGGRLLSQGQDVYNQVSWVGAHSLYGSTWIPNLYYVYPLTTAALFVPLGLLPIASAAWIWLLASFIFIIVSLVLLLRLWQVPDWKKFIIPFTLGLLLFRPVILIFLMGQIDGLLLLLIVLSIFFAARGKNSLAFILLGFLVLKPNIGAPILCLLALWLLTQKQWKNIFSLGGSTLVLLVLPVLIDPHWIEKYIQVGLYKSQDQNVYPTLRGLAGLLSNNNPLFTNILWLAGSVLLLGFFVWIFLKYRKTLTSPDVMSLSIIISLMVTPYLRSYDLLLLLIPIMQILSDDYLKHKSFFKTNLYYLLWGLFSFALLFLATRLQHDIFSLFYTFSVLIVYAIVVTHRQPKDLVG